jgi:hypothetical protein
MTLVSSIIRDAYRETNLIPLVSDPNATQITEALGRLNPLILDTVGFEAGDELKGLNYGGEFDQSSYIDQWLPDDIRLVLNLTTATSVDADPFPYEGQRLAIVDVGSNLATFNLTINGNGHLIEAATSVVLNTDDLARQWMYRADTANWVRIASLATSDEMPFPTEFDDYFIIMLASRLNPRYGQALAPETVRMLSRTRNMLRARYRCRKTYAPTDPGLVKPEDDYFYSSPQDSFNLGYYYPRFY